MDLLIQGFNKEIQNNEAATLQCKKNISDYKTLRSNLQTYQNELSPQIMVPLGSKALMRGKLVHTNEVLVHIGDGYLVKNSVYQALQICDRRIKSAEELLGNLEKEKSWFENSLSLQSDGVFGDSDKVDIQEEYNEETETEWKRKHRESVRNYHQQAAKNKNEENMLTDEEYWERLDMLELQEELEAHLEGLSAEDRAIAEGKLYDLKQPDDTEKYDPNKNMNEDHQDFEEGLNCIQNVSRDDHQLIKEEIDFRQNVSKDDHQDIKEVLGLKQNLSGDDNDQNFEASNDGSAVLLAYKKQLKEIQANINNFNVENDKDILNKLDLYEKMEEIQEKISLMEDNDSNDTDNITISDESDKENEKTFNVDSSDSLSKKTKKVMFAENNSVKVIDSEEPVEPLRIEFTHSSVKPISPISNKTLVTDIETPYDIYSVFKNCFDYNKTPSSILKNKELVHKENHVRWNHKEDNVTEDVPRNKIKASVVIGEVFENKVVESAIPENKSETAKPISRFKAMRQGKK